MKNVMIKIWDFIKYTFILSIFFLGTEYLLYDLLSTDNKLYYFFFIIFLILVGVSIDILNKRKKFNAFINSAIVLAGVFFALGILWILIKFI
ncbi:MAG: hypothetical protein IJW04_07725 [Ruminococcus sp.]|nr:hypothetical protein [Ruminococcus sp.]